MGRSLIVLVVDEELLADAGLHAVVNGTVVRLDDLLADVASYARHLARSEYPDAFFVVRIPVAAVWKPPAEPPGLSPDDEASWHAHEVAVGLSLDSHLNAALEPLDGMLRTGAWVLGSARVMMVECVCIRGIAAPDPSAVDGAITRTKSSVTIDLDDDLVIDAMFAIGRRVPMDELVELALRELCDRADRIAACRRWRAAVREPVFIDPGDEQDREPGEE